MGNQGCHPYRNLGRKKYPKNQKERRTVVGGVVSKPGGG